MRCCPGLVNPARSGRDLFELDFFLALGYWKLAIILEGVYARYVARRLRQGRPRHRSLLARLAEAAESAD